MTANVHNGMDAAMEFTNRSGFRLKAVYGAAGSEMPGEYPYTRGRRPTPHSTGAWIQRELCGEGDGARTNEQINYLLAHGQTGIDVIGDAPTQSLLDADHPLSKHAVGTQGVSLCCQQDYLDLLNKVPIGEISVSSSVPPVMAIPGLVIAAEHAGVALGKLRGSVNQPPLYAEDCAYAYHLPVEFRTRMTLDSMEFCAQHMPKFHSYVEDTYFFCETGLDAVEEMALGFVQIRHITRSLIARGVPVDSFAPRIAILVNCGMDFYAEIAKIRATRRLYATMMREEFGATNDRSWSAAISSHTSGISMTAQQPVNNIIRGATQALALVMSGVQALEISAFDEAFRTPSKEAHLVGLRTQQIIDLESEVGRVMDPFGGSYFMEELTDHMEQRIRARIAEIEGLGHAHDLANRGYFRDIFHNAMQEMQRRTENQDLKVVGVNMLRIPEEDDHLLRDVSEGKIEPWTQQIDRIRALKQTRDAQGARQALAGVGSAVTEGTNLCGPVIEALRASATTGEIVTIMRRALGMPADLFDHPLP